MKKMSMALCVMAAPITVAALPIGNPTEASIHCEGVYRTNSRLNFWDPTYCWCHAWSLRCGYYGDFVFDHHLRVHHEDDHSHIHRTKLHTNGGYLALNLWDLFDIFGILGASQVHITSANSAFGVFTGSTGFDFINIDTDTHFAWSVGVRGTLWERGCFGIGAEAQFFQTRPNVRYVVTEAFDPVYPSNLHLKFEEWQVGIGAAYRINLVACSTALIPYAGIKWNHVRVDAAETMFPELAQVGTPTLFDLESEREWGWAIGMTLLGYNRASITAEGRFADEKALYINGQLRF